MILRSESSLLPKNADSKQYYGLSQRFLFVLKNPLERGLSKGFVVARIIQYNLILLSDRMKLSSFQMDQLRKCRLVQRASNAHLMKVILR